MIGHRRASPGAGGAPGHCAGRAAAQEPPPDPAPEQAPSPVQPAAPPVMSSPAWRWSAEASAFAGYNYQHRKFLDFDAWESQNWVMAALDRPGRAGT